MTSGDGNGQQAQAATSDRTLADVEQGLGMPLQEAMSTQRAVRRLLPDPVDDAIVLRCSGARPQLKRRLGGIVGGPRLSRWRGRRLSCWSRRGP